MAVHRLVAAAVEVALDPVEHGADAAILVVAERVGEAVLQRVQRAADVERIGRERDLDPAAEHQVGVHVDERVHVDLAVVDLLAERGGHLVEHEGAAGRERAGVSFGAVVAEAADAVLRLAIRIAVQLGEAGEIERVERAHVVVAVADEDRDRP